MSAAREAEQNAFLVRTVTILVLCMMTLNNFALVSLLPYIGVMVMDLLGLKTSNEAGEDKFGDAECRQRRHDNTTRRIKKNSSSVIVRTGVGAVAKLLHPPQNR